MRTLFFLSLLLCTLAGNAQLERGTLLLSGSNSFITAPPQLVTAGVVGGGVSGKNANGNSTNFFGLRMSPSIGVAVSNALVIGGNIRTWSTWQDGEQFGELSIAPFARYYFGTDESSLLPFGEASIGYSRFDDEFDYFSYQLTAGAAYRLNGQISLEGRFFFSDNSLGNDFTSSQMLGLELGLTAFLNASDRSDGDAAPYGAGDWIIGAAGLNISSTKNAGVRRTSISVQPSAQYLLSDQLAVGGTVRFGHQRFSTDFSGRSTDFVVGPTARYYFGAPSNRPFFATLGVLYARSKTTDYFLFGSSFPNPTPEPFTSVSNALQIGLGFGQQLFLTDKLALEYGPRIGFYQNLDNLESASSSPVRINLEIGLQYFL